MTDFDIGGYNFEELSRLAKDDPQAFEALREREIQRLINSAPPASRRRLQGLQWQIDVERDHAESPLGACMRLSRMMWDSVVGQGGLLERIDDLQSGTPLPPPEVSADVLPFRPAGKTEDDGHDTS